MLSMPIAATEESPRVLAGALAPSSITKVPGAPLFCRRGPTGADAPMPAAFTPSTIFVAPARPSLPGGKSCLAALRPSFPRDGEPGMPLVVSGTAVCVIHGMEDRNVMTEMLAKFLPGRT